MGMVMMVFYEYCRSWTVSAQFAHHGKSCKESSSNLSPDVLAFSRDGFHIHLLEDVGEEFHAVVVIDSHELVILLLGNLMADALSVDDGCHAKLGVAFLILLDFSLLITYWLNLDVINLNLSAMLAFTEPSLVFVLLIQAIAIYMSNTAVFWLDSNLVAIRWERLVNHHLLAVVEFCLYLWSELQADLLFGIEHIHRQFVLEIVPDGIVDDVNAVLDRYLLDGIVGQFLHFILSEVIDKVLLGGSGLDGECFVGCIYDDAMRRKTLLPFVIAEINLRGDEFVVWLGRFLGTWTNHYRGND